MKIQEMNCYKKDLKTTMEIAHHKSANAALENDILTKLNNVTGHIKHLEAQLQKL
jgi:hypothetical protein